MCESIKLKNLLNKVKSSIQLQVHKRKPKTTTEFLAYATKVEELLQLSNVSIETNINYPCVSLRSNCGVSAIAL